MLTLSKYFQFCELKVYESNIFHTTQSPYFSGGKNREGIVEHTLGWLHQYNQVFKKNSVQKGPLSSRSLPTLSLRRFFFLLSTQQNQKKKNITHNTASCKDMKKLYLPYLEASFIYFYFVPFFFQSFFWYDSKPCPSPFEKKKR